MRSPYKTRYEIDRMEYATALIKQSLEEERAFAIHYRFQTTLDIQAGKELSVSDSVDRVKILHDATEKRTQVLLAALHDILHAE